jgi:hypothetical protein
MFCRVEDIPATILVSVDLVSLFAAYHVRNIYFHCISAACHSADNALDIMVHSTIGRRHDSCATSPQRPYVYRTPVHGPIALYSKLAVLRPNTNVNPTNWTKYTFLVTRRHNTFKIVKFDLMT